MSIPPLPMATRRQVLTALTASVGAIAIAQPAVGQGSAVIKPPRLRPGSTVGLISPASATFLQRDVDVVVDAIQALGLVPRLAPHLLARYGSLAGRDQERAGDVNQFFADPQVDALMPIRGGWGCSRILPYLDYELIRRNPKILVGFSDVTSLLLGIHAQTGLVTFHGPNGLTGWRTVQTDSFRRVLFEGEATTVQNSPNPGDGDRLMQVDYRIQTLTPGRSQGRLLGGNLSVLSGIVGTPYLPDLTGAILFLEDVGESPYRLDRMMTHLKLAGVFDHLAGFIFGQCPNCTPDEGYGSLTLEEIVRDHIQPLGIPAWIGAMIGHIEPMLTLPIGLPVEIDAASGTIRLLESAVLTE